MRRDLRKRHDGGELQPCIRCGAEKEHGQGRRYCQECRELALWLKERKSKARPVRDRKPCQRCGGVKAPGHGRRYCERCKAKPAPKCLDCGVEIKRPATKCEVCKADTRERERAANRVRSRERRRRLRAAGVKKVRNPAQLERDKETRRLGRRTQREREGRPIPALSEAAYVSRYGHGWAQNDTRLDPAPLVPHLREIVEDQEVGEFCKAARVSDRTFWKIVHGEVDAITLRAYDRLCLQLGLHPDVVEVA